MKSEFRLEAKKIQKGKGFFFFSLLLFQCAVLGALNFSPHFLKNFENLSSFSFWLGFLFFALSVFFLFFFGAMTDRAFFLCAAFKGSKKTKKEKKPSLFGGALISAMFFLLKAVLFLLFLFPSGGAFFFLLFGMRDGLPVEAAVVLSGSVFVLLFLGLFFFQRVKALFFLAKYIYFSSPKLSAFDCFKKSADIMSSHLGEYFELKRSFSGWFFLCVFLFPFLFVRRYFRQTLALFAFNLIQNEL